MNLIDYIEKFSQAVKAGEGDSINMIFFGVLVSEEANSFDLKKSTCDFLAAATGPDIFDGNEHSYIEIGAILGSQDLALKLMAMGSKLKLWDLLSPYTVLGNIDPQFALSIAGQGMITVVKRKGAGNEM